MMTEATKEVFLQENEFIVSKTDLTGRIVYTNQIFRRICGYSERELLGQPHSLIRHPDMPRCIFKLLWDKLGANEEIFAYVKNTCKDDSFYWVFAHVTPSFNEAGEKTGYHSNRRKPDLEGLELIKPLYQRLLAIENSEVNKKTGMMKSYEFFQGLLSKYGMTYDQFIFDFTKVMNKSDFSQEISSLRIAS